MIVLTTKDIKGHDSFVQKVMTAGNLAVAKEFFTEYLPASVLRLVDINTLKVENDNLNDNILVKGRVDLLYSAKSVEGVDDINYFQILLEHQSKADYWMAFRIDQYRFKIWAEHHKKYPKCKKLPYIFPMVLYSGKGSYKAPRSIWDLCKYPKEIRESFINECLIIDVSKIADEELLRMRFSGVMQYLLKHIHDKDITPGIKILAPSLTSLSRLNEGFYIQAALLYTLQKGASNSTKEIVELFKEAVENNQKEDVMTIADALRMEGRLEGEAMGEARGKMEGKIEGKLEGKMEGKLEGKMEEKIRVAQAMLVKGFEISLIVEMTSLTEKQIEEIKLGNPLFN